MKGKCSKKYMINYSQSSYFNKKNTILLKKTFVVCILALKCVVFFPKDQTLRFYCLNTFVRR